MKDQIKSDECARFLKALSEPERLRIIQCLLSGPKCVSELAELLKEELANVSHHLGILRNAGLVQNHKEGKYVVYDLHPDVCLCKDEFSAAVLELGCCRLQLGQK